MGTDDFDSIGTGNSFIFNSGLPVHGALSFTQPAIRKPDDYLTIRLVDGSVIRVRSTKPGEYHFDMEDSAGRPGLPPLVMSIGNGATSITR